MLDEVALKQRLTQRFLETNFDQARNDVHPFVRDADALALSDHLGRPSPALTRLCHFSVSLRALYGLTVTHAQIHCEVGLCNKSAARAWFH
jgi:hypothetical protein